MKPEKRESPPLGYQQEANRASWLDQMDHLLVGLICVFIGALVLGGGMVSHFYLHNPWIAANGQPGFPVFSLAAILPIWGGCWMLLRIRR